MSFLKKWFGTSGKEKQAAEIARREAERARRIQEAALTNTADSENARAGAERRLRRIGAMRGISGVGRGSGGTAQLALAQLLGR